MGKWFLGLVTVATLLTSADRAAAQCQSCTTDYNNCTRPASVGRDVCYDNCDGYYPPGPDLDACRDGCQGEYIVQIQGCQDTYNECWAYCWNTGCSGPAPTCPSGSASCNMSTRQWECVSPILIDTDNSDHDRGFELTSAADGVLFDLMCDGRQLPVAWTARGSEASWLVLDRNGNGNIDDGTELFGSATPQPQPGEGELRNGFAALRVYDDPSLGGNGDGFIDAHDAIFPSLRLWRDSNHNGETDPGELQTLPSRGIGRIALRYHVANQVDEFGNAFYLKGRAFDLGGRARGIFLWDVFLTTIK
ncbi:MAG TPA: hypothetical protein VGN09_18250 [Vicinamibacteria bacterium]|jgi:hypothetical protein